LATGDVGYTVDQQIVVCGRRNDVIFMGGRHIYPTDVERAASTVTGVGHTVIAVRICAGTSRERFAIVLESKLAGDGGAETALALEVTARVTAAVDAEPLSVVVVPPGSLPKTTSGKPRRAAATALFANQINQLTEV
jgi:fatty-acyl-CoA synthase